MEHLEILINAQIAIFYAQKLPHPDSIAEKIIKIFPIKFLDPVISFVPADDVFDFHPVVTFESADGLWVCTLSRLRADLKVLGSGVQVFGDISNDFKEMSDIFYRFFKDQGEIKVSRIGFISRFFVADASQDSCIKHLLSSSFIQLHGNATGEGDNLFVGAHLTYAQTLQLFGVAFNNYTSIEKYFANIAGEGNDIPGILITRDINTVPVAVFDVTYPVIDIKAIIDECPAIFKIRHFIMLLWP